MKIFVLPLDDMEPRWVEHFVLLDIEGGLEAVYDYVGKLLDVDVENLMLKVGEYLSYVNNMVRAKAK